MESVIEAIRISSARDGEFDQGDRFVVRVEHDLMAEAREFSPLGAMILGMRLVVAGEIARQGEERDVCVALPDEKDAQALCTVQAFQTADDRPAVRLLIANFEVKMNAAAAVWIAARLAFASDLAKQNVEHEMTSEDLTENLIHSAYVKLLGMAFECHARAVHFLERGEGNDGS